MKYYTAFFSKYIGRVQVFASYYSVFVFSCGLLGVCSKRWRGEGGWKRGKDCERFEDHVSEGKAQTAEERITRVVGTYSGLQSKGKGLHQWHVCGLFALHCIALLLRAVAFLNLSIFCILSSQNWGMKFSPLWRWSKMDGFLLERWVKST